MEGVGGVIDKESWLDGDVYASLSDKYCVFVVVLFAVQDAAYICGSKY